MFIYLQGDRIQRERVAPRHSARVTPLFSGYDARISKQMMITLSVAAPMLSGRQ